MADENNVPVELSDTEVEKAVGGAVRTPGAIPFRIASVDGESTDDKHKGE